MTLLVRHHPPENSMPKSVLVADDSLTIRKIVGMLFATEDLTVTAVDNGLDAVTRARELRPDLVLADCMMPGKSGYDVCAELKRDPATAHIPVLLLAGNFEPFDAARAQACGANGHIPKPFDSTSFLDRVKSSVGMATGGSIAPVGYGTPMTAAAAAAAVPQAPSQPMAPPARPAAPPAQPMGMPQARPGTPMATQPGQPLRPPMQPGMPMGQPGMPPARPPMQGGVPMGMQPMGTQPGMRPPMGQPGMPPRPVGAPMPPMGAQPGMPRPMGVPGMPGTMPPGPGMARPPMQGMPGMPPAPGMPGGFPRPPSGGPLPGAGMPPPRRDPFGLANQQQQPPPQRQHESLDLDSHKSADGGEAVLREALSKASKDVIEKIAWEVVPQLAETIIRQELDRLIKDREAKGLA
jgi:CheY-like chemotaxis protein